MQKEEEKQQNIKLLKQLIYEYENQNWLKMGTRTSLATYVVERGFYPNSKIYHYQSAIDKVIEELQDLLEQSDNCGISTLETKKIIKMLKSI